MNTNEKNYFKIALVFVLCMVARLIPFRAPNIEPILAATMPIGKAYGRFFGFFFALFSILLYDTLTGTLGLQTFFTAGAYGIIALWSVNYFEKHKADRWGYVRFAIMGTLFFDAVTGLSVGPIFFHQSLMSTFFGQIPFTAFHLLGNITFAFILSPAIYSFILKKKKKKRESVLAINNFNPKTI
jgi:uncharacterized membrane protein